MSAPESNAEKKDVEVETDAGYADMVDAYPGQAATAGVW